MTRAVLFDLDETLMVEEPAAVASFMATAELASTRHRAVEASRLATDARSRARELWYAAETHEYCMRTGISSWEGLWCGFEWDGPDAQALREWSPAYRRETWRLGLLDQGVDDRSLAGELADRFGVERRARHEVFADAAPSLDALNASYSLGLVTNGAACLQREKIAASGLGHHFDAIVVSADLGTAKPAPVVFDHTLSELDVDPGRAVMVGDSIAKDVDGALAAGLGAVWLNRRRDPRPKDRADLCEISTLSELPAALMS